MRQKLVWFGILTALAILLPVGCKNMPRTPVRTVAITNAPVVPNINPRRTVQTTSIGDLNADTLVANPERTFWLAWERSPDAVSYTVAGYSNSPLHRDFAVNVTTNRIPDVRSIAQYDYRQCHRGQ